MIVHKFTLMIAGILGLLAQISMAQSSATMTTSTLPAVQTGLVAGSDNNISSAYDYELYTGDSDEGNDEYLDEDYEDIDEYLDEDNALDKDEFFDIDDSEMSMIVKKDGRPGHRRKKPHGYRGWKGRCNPGFLCQAKYYGQACRCTRLKESCSCNEPVFN